MSRERALYDGPIFPGNGYPRNPGEDRPGLSPFGRLAMGQALGKSSLLRYDAESSRIQPAEVPMITVEGDDLDACQLCLTLAPPRVIPIAFADLLIGDQNLTGEQLNSEVSADPFPGIATPVAWPPLEAVVEWGIKGASARAVVDYVNGVTINVVASYLRVTAVVTQSQQSGEIVGTSAAYYLAAFVGPGWTRTGTARRTVYIGTVALDNESAVFDIPPFASKVYLVGCDTATPPNVAVGYVRFWQSVTGSAGGTNVGNVLVSSNQPGPFLIPAGAAYFSVYNQSPTMKIAAIFELAI